MSPNGDLGIAVASYPSQGGDESQTDFRVAESVIAMMEEHRNGPWFLGAGLFKPHVPWIVPSTYFDMYSPDQIEIPPFDPSEMSIAPKVAYTTNPPNYGMSGEQHRQAFRAYCAATSFVDAQAGRLVDAVERLGLKQDTTIVFWSDHGFQLGEHGQWQKMALFEPSVRVPLIIAGAGVGSTTGASCPRTVENLSIYPTLVELCGIQGAPSGLQGRSLAPLLSNPNAPWEHPAVSQVTRGFGANPVMGYSIRTERHRYTMWAGGAEGEELYDYDSDPRELRNLAADVGSAALKAKLRSRLEQLAHARGMARA
jgi:iduronate 2-sulfatase